MRSELSKSLVDPWNYSGCIPDGSKHKGCFTTRELYHVEPGDDGATACCLVVTGVPYCASYNSGPDSQTTWQLPNTGVYAQLSSYNMINGLYAKCRLVSMGIKVRFTGSNFNNEGQCVLAQIPGNVPPNLLHNKDLGEIPAITNAFHVFDNRTTKSITWRPEDQEDYTFRPATDGITNLASVAPLPWLFFGATGIDETANYIVEVVRNYEGEFKLGSISTNDGKSENTIAQVGWYEKAMNAVRLTSQIGTEVGMNIALGGMQGTLGAIRAANAPPMIGWRQ